ncbi:hypothetical protein [Halalkalicoccus ordinarius]|uniref:hypothetical protein n=1 Tax=Halalkalicoccus ordinarius TaxID=3116651 RepID=UPI00300F0FBB
MTGLKSGSGDDLWGEDIAEESESGTETTEVESTANEGQQQPDESSNTTPENRSRSEPREGGTTSQQQPYIVRRAIQDKSVQFERDERLTFFVHNDVIEGERQLLTEVETALGRDVPKFDIREAVYRAALRNRDDVLNELIEMGYSANTE